MTLLALASIKGSPGVTTTAIAMAATWPQPSALLESDPAGGDLAAALNLPTSPGLVDLAAAARRTTSGAQLRQFAQKLAPGGPEAIVAPVGADQSQAAVRALADSPLLPAVARDPEFLTIADCGRLDPKSPALDIAGKATQTLLVIRPRSDELAHLAPRIPTLFTRMPTIGLVLVGPAEYSAREISETLRLPVLANLPFDRRGAEITLRSGLAQRRAGRVPVVKAVRSLAERLHASPAFAQQPEGRSATPPKKRVAERPISPGQARWS